MAGPPQFQPWPRRIALQCADITAVKALAEGRPHRGSGRRLMQFRVSPKTLSETAAPRNGRRGSISPPRTGWPSCRVFRRHLQPSDLRGAGHAATATTRSRSARIGPRSRPPASWKSASTTARSSAARARSSAPAIASTRRSTRRCRRRRRVFHTHMPYASALTRLEDPRIKEIGQTEVGLSGAIAYDDELYRPGARSRRRRAAGRRDRRQEACCSWPITASPPSARPSPRPMTCSITSSAPRRCRSTRCGPGRS